MQQKNARIQSDKKKTQQKKQQAWKNLFHLPKGLPRYVFISYVSQSQSFIWV